MRRKPLPRPLPTLLLPLLTLASGGLVTDAAAQPFEYQLELQARSSFTAAFNLPAGAFFANTTARIDDSRRVAFDLAVLPGGTGQGLWYGGGGSGSIVYETPADAFIFDTGIDDLGRVVFEQQDSPQDGLWIYDPASPPAAFATSQPLGAGSWGSPGIDEFGRLGYRAGFTDGNAYASYDGTPTAAIHATEAGIDPGSPYSFLFTPSFNSRREIAGKVRFGAAGEVGESQPDEIRVFADDGSFRVIARDVDSDPASPYTRFDNSVALTDSGAVAFIAELIGGARAVVFSDGMTEVTIASEDDPDISEIEFFGPAANDHGLVAFRAMDGAGLRAVWAGDGDSLGVIAREHDLVPSDLGTARIDQHDSSPVFGGGVAINRWGDVTFQPGLTPPDNNQVEWGSGVYAALSSAVFTDGFESGDAAAWSAAVP